MEMSTPRAAPGGRWHSRSLGLHNDLPRRAGSLSAPRVASRPARLAARSGSSGGHRVASRTRGPKHIRPAIHAAPDAPAGPAKRRARQVGREAFRTLLARPAGTRIGFGLGTSQFTD